MSVYPRSLSHYLNRLSGYNKNTVKLNVLGSTSASQGDIIQVDLPTNSIVDLSSFCWSLRLAYTAEAATQSMALPQNAEAIIDRLEVQVNGQSLINITNYNTLFHTLLYTTATEDYQRMRKISWLGFLGNSKPNFIDTSLLGNVRIQITLNNGDIISNTVADAAPALRNFAITQQHFSVDVISISDGIYDSMIDSMLASGKPIEVPFKNYLSYTHTTGSMNVNMPFSISSQSIDRLWAIARDSTYNAATSKTANVAAGPGTDATGTNYSTLAHPYFNFSNRGGTDFQFTVNNTTYPSYSSVDARDWQKQLRGAIGDQGNMLSGCVPTSLKQYTDNYFAFAVSLEHHSGADERFVSGIDTRGASANCMFKSVDGGASGNHQIVVFAELTSILEIKANKVITVIQ